MPGRTCEVLNEGAARGCCGSWHGGMKRGPSGLRRDSKQRGRTSRHRQGVPFLACFPCWNLPVSVILGSLLKSGEGKWDWGGREGVERAGPNWEGAGHLPRSAGLWDPLSPGGSHVPITNEAPSQTSSLSLFKGQSPWLVAKK